MTKITLEMVDEVINRTGASYKEAKDALEFCEGDILDAVVYIETKREHGRDYKREFTDKTNEMIETAKELIKKGNVTRVLVEKNDRAFLDLPVNAGGIAALFFAGPTLVALIAAIAIGCQLKIVKDDGEVINVNDMVEAQMGQVKEKVDEFKDKLKRTEEEVEKPVEEDDTEIVEAKFMDEENKNQE